MEEGDGDRALCEESRTFLRCDLVRGGESLTSCLGLILTRGPVPARDKSRKPLEGDSVIRDGNCALG